MKFPYIVKRTLAVFCFLFAANIIQAQAGKKTVRFNEIMLNSFISGNSFGVQRNLSAGITLGKRFGLNAGPTFNRGFQKNTGGIISAHYYMVNDNESFNGHFRLISILSLQRMRNQSLCNNVVALEEQMAFNMKNDEKTDFYQMRYMGWEGSAGIGFAYRCNFGLMIRAEASLCYYTVNRQSCKEINTFHDENGTSLRLGFGIGWSIPKKLSSDLAKPKASEDDSVLLLQHIE